MIYRRNTHHRRIRRQKRNNKQTQKRNFFSQFSSAFSAWLQLGIYLTSLLLSICSNLEQIHAHHSIPAHYPAKGMPVLGWCVLILKKPELFLVGVDFVAVIGT